MIKRGNQVTICTYKHLQMPRGTLDKREDESCSLIFFQGTLLGSRHLKRLSGFYDEHANDEVWTMNNYTARGHSLCHVKTQNSAVLMQPAS